MNQYRKKPVVIDAFQLPALDEDVAGFAEWAARVEFDGYTSEREGCMAIETLEGTMTAEPGDWIIKGVRGEFYPCNPAIFAATYERADLAPDAAPPTQCQCPACKVVLHASDCAVHNAPALPNGPCDCGSQFGDRATFEAWAEQHSFAPSTIEGAYVPELANAAYLGWHARASAAQAPLGWKLVPVAPTDEMLIAMLNEGETNAYRTWRGDQHTHTVFLRISGIRQRYQAMLEVAPAAQTLTDEQTIERCKSVGIRWLSPEPEDGFPGAFELVEMHEMRALLGAPAASEAETPRDA
ncbi:hypothetical protein [Paraburkholderia pallida]|uniref:hypothetical protein n=1 Tax=Paraburkholderia pallida TaxID=2547399 RepID=UPI0018D86BD8|nr:hypothetical protein [Paraburkholderia pallida]